MKQEEKVPKESLKAIAGGVLPNCESSYVKDNFYQEFQTSTLKQESKDIFLEKSQKSSQLNKFSTDFKSGKISKGTYIQFLEDIQDLEDQYYALNLEISKRNSGKVTIYK